LDLDQEDMQRNSQKRKRKQEVLGNTVWLASTEEKYFQEPQKAFQPTASELDLKRRFLVFNKIGTITARDESSHFAIEISFHDISRNRIIKLVDRNNSTMADLGENGAVFASKIKASILSTILYHPIESWGSNAKWSIQLPAEEEVDAICLGETIVAAATNRSFLRLFTFSGVQYHLFSLHGPIVSMAAFKRQVAVIYHGGMPFLGNQNLQLLLLDTSKRSIIHQGPVAIASYSTLRWLGFSPSGILVVHDSAGVVRMLLDDWKQWTPVQILQPNEWVFGVSDQYLHCVSLKDDEQSPPLVPKPIPHTIPLCIPLLQKELDTTAFEEAFLRESLITKHKEHLLQDAIEVKEKVLLDTYLMQLIENAIRTDRTERALNLADMIQFEKPLLGVINMAHQRGLRILKEKLEGLLVALNTFCVFFLFARDNLGSFFSPRKGNFLQRGRKCLRRMSIPTKTLTKQTMNLKIFEYPQKSHPNRNPLRYFPLRKLKITFLQVRKKRALLYYPLQRATWIIRTKNRLLLSPKKAHRMLKTEETLISKTSKTTIPLKEDHENEIGLL